jgi:hypothetical protein
MLVGVLMPLPVMADRYESSGSRASTGSLSWELTRNSRSAPVSQAAVKKS